MPAQQIDPADDPRNERPEPSVTGFLGSLAPDPNIELDREAILAAEDRPMERHAVPEWGGHVFVVTISGYERDQFDRYMARHVDEKTDQIVGCNWRSALLARCLSNSRGELLFSEEDIEALGRKSGAVLDRLFAVARRLNRMDQQDIDEIKKKSAAARPGSSQPDSAGTSEGGGPPASASGS